MWRDVSPPQLQVVWRDWQPVNTRGRASPGVLTAGQQRTGGALRLEDSHLVRTVECQATGLRPSGTFAGVMTLSRLEVEAPFLISPSW